MKQVMEKAQAPEAVIAARRIQHIPGLAPVDMQVQQTKVAAKAKPKAGGVSQAVGASQ